MSSLSVRDIAVDHLLQPPAVEYVRSLKELVEKDPNYVKANREDIGNILHGFLAGAGIHWAQEIFERDWPEILQEAIARLSEQK